MESGLAGGALLELGGADEAQRRVAPERIVEAVDVAGQSVARLGPGLEDGAPHQLAFQRLEERLTMELSLWSSPSIGSAVPLAGH